MLTDPPTKFFDITNFTPSTASLGAGESAAFFVAAQTVGTGFEFSGLLGEGIDEDITSTATEPTAEQTSATTEQTSATTEQTSATTTEISSATTGDSTSTEQTTQTKTTSSSTERASTESAPTESISTESTSIESASSESTITGQSTQISTSQSPESTTTTPGNPETTPSSTTKATPVMNGIYHSLVSNFQPPGSVSLLKLNFDDYNLQNSIIGIYNGTDDNSQELYSNA